MENLSLLESTDSELEEERLAQARLIADEREKSTGEIVPDHSPGSLGYHEAMHVASIVLDLVDQRLLNHPAIVGNSDLFRLASRASEALFNLYQSMGAAALDNRHEDGGTRPEDLNASNDG